MNLLSFPGGWYCDARPDGRYAVVMPDRIVTDTGDIPLLDGVRPLYLRLAEAGGNLAGQHERTNHVLEWDGEQWVEHDDLACGTSGVIYDKASVLHAADCAEVGVNGYRYVTPDNVVVTGDATYGPAPGVPWICEWTALGDGLYVGQGQPWGIIVWDGQHHRMFRPPDGRPCRFIRARRDGDRVSLAWYEQAGGLATDAFVCWLTVEALRALPVYAIPQNPEPGTPTPPPVEPPPVVIPPEPEPMKIPADVVATIREFASVYPVPHGDGSEEWIDSALRSIPDGWIHRLAQTVAARHGTQWGRKRASLDRPLSKESIALNENGLHGWDLLAGAATGRPTLQTDSYHDLVAEGNQLFVPVEPFDHLGNVPVSPINRPALPFAVSASSFDWHLHRDLRWLDFLESVGIRTLRLVVASVFRHGASLAEGRHALRSGLQILRERGMFAIVTIHTDTRERGLSREDVKSHSKKTSDILVDFLDVVPGARLCNENSHSVEQSFMSDPWFLLELDLLVDARIPLAWGANHGGEPVSAALAGGSWIAFHSDRDKMPDENAAIMRAAQDRFGKPVVDDEPIGFYVENQPGRRRNDPRFATLQALAARDAGLGGTTLHLDAGIDADVDKLDHVQREAARLFGEVFAGLEGPVTVDQIAKVFAGAFFEDVTKLLKLTGTVEERRIKVHDWARAKCRVTNQAYIDIFKRPCDLEGYGSRLLLFVDHGWTDDQLRKALQDAYDRGDR